MLARMAAYQGDKVMGCAVDGCVGEVSLVVGVNDPRRHVGFCQGHLHKVPELTREPGLDMMFDTVPSAPPTPLSYPVPIGIGGYAPGRNEWLVADAVADAAADVVAEVGPLPRDAKERKALPLFSGVLKYFPDALVAVAELSRIGNDQHNPGQPLHWDKSKSTDHADCLVRHLLESGTLDSDRVRHSAKVAWRALALLQIEIEAERDQAKCVLPSY